VKPRASAHHLLESNGRADIFKKDYIANAGDIYTSGNQVHSGSNEMASHRAAQISDVLTPANSGSAFKGVGLKSLFPIIRTPISIKVIHFSGNGISMGIPSTKDNRFLKRVASLKKHIK
jgi:hypothetical protein